MLKVETLKANEALTGITHEQFQLIATMSENDESQVISAKTKEIHSKYDADIKELTGLDKPGGIKTYDHLKTVIVGLQESGKSVKGLTDQIASLTSEKVELERKIKEGSTDAVLKSKVESLEQKIKDKDGELGQLKTSFETKESDYQKQISDIKASTTNLQINQAFDKYLVDNKVTFKSSIPDTVLKEILGTRKSNVISGLKPDFIEEKGVNTMVFRDDKGEILRNEKNAFKPFTAGELLFAQIGDLVNDKTPKGGGGTGVGGGNPIPVNLDLSGAKTQMAADILIVEHILKNEGISKTDSKFSTRQSEIRTEQKVSELPLR